MRVSETSTVIRNAFVRDHREDNAAVEGRELQDQGTPGQGEDLGLALHTGVVSVDSYRYPPARSPRRYTRMVTIPIIAHGSRIVPPDHIEKQKSLAVQQK